MRILTVRQPWAWAIIHAGKNVENRVRNVAGNYRGPIAIHAAKAWDKEWPEDHAIADAMSDWMTAHDTWGEDDKHPWNQQRGAIIGVVDLVDVHTATPDDHGQIRCSKGARYGTWGRACSDWADESNYHLMLTDPRPLAEPIPYKGALGLRRLDTETTARVLAQIGQTK